MADDDTTSTEETGTGTDETSETETTGSESTTEEPKPKSELPPEAARALRKANKEAADLRHKLKEYEDRDKTEQQKLTEKASESEREANELRAELLRNKVALAKGLTAEQSEFLVGDDEESLLARADKILALTKPGRPAGDVDQGARGGNGPKQWTEADLKNKPPEQIAAALEKGQLANLL